MTVRLKNFWLWLGIFVAATVVRARSVGIPTIPLVPAAGRFSLSNVEAIVVDGRYADSVNDKGETLIPPTLEEFAKTFSSDLEELNWSIPIKQGGVNESTSTIFLTLGDPADYHDAAGRESSEGYTLSTSSSGITVTGASPLGVWWGTRTIIQQAVLNNGSLPFGTVNDTPGWGLRGMMLDAGRHYYPPDFLIEMCAYMSFFKQNTFHLHLSDNLYNNENYTREQSLALYARFRLWSDAKELEGLNQYKNESYTEDQFHDIQTSCAARGVTIIPEIEAPGHALVFVQWKPELGLADDLSLLNISHPDTIPTIKGVWSTFLPWFKSKTVHIGADEYTAEVNDYNVFVNAMADHVRTTADKSIRIWGTFPPNYTEPGYVNIYKNVTIQHWAFFEDNPLYDYILNDYSVVNSDDTFYAVQKWPVPYPTSPNVSATFLGNPENGGSLWYPNIFDRFNASNNPARDEPRVLGHTAPLWNDHGPTATVYSEAYYAWREAIPALADKQWGGDITSAEFYTTLSSLHASIPGQNLERKIPSKSPTILNYTLSTPPTKHTSPSNVVPDTSGNAYDGTTDCPLTPSGSLNITSTCSLDTPLSSKGRNYTLTLSLLISALTNPENATLISGRDSTLLLTPNITFFASGYYYSLNSTLPLDTKIDLEVVGRGNRTFARVDGGTEEEFTVRLGIYGREVAWAGMPFEAPVRRVGGRDAGWEGEVFGVALVDGS
ncbi:glycoside hydrolase family 20 protein [Aaosphaeria arxii CBS 175.79]|uniref:beta-N-acetylhexosaminidase n=1 Tax=Aaosphaeria arxii CBS 175.79 TaxID=1450172 RepID=A0A6A5XVD0_9PLEO|nr:glycoside hydrolase family 20 protein [Aaosphaeria arxii CBS 175.79]KAF2016899.1 glycoside hydrolase family 20 protein [Aaosphaeria arxii CBS 175.79]